MSAVKEEKRGRESLDPIMSIRFCASAQITAALARLSVPPVSPSTARPSHNLSVGVRETAVDPGPSSLPPDTYTRPVGTPERVEIVCRIELRPKYATALSPSPTSAEGSQSISYLVTAYRRNSTLKPPAAITRFLVVANPVTVDMISLVGDMIPVERRRSGSTAPQ